VNQTKKSHQRKSRRIKRKRTKKRKKEKKKVKKDKKEKKIKHKKEKKAERLEARDPDNGDISVKRFAPMSKEEWEKQQSIVRRVFDEDTGRMRLVKGTGEILEECVSRDRQQAINKQATMADGESFQRSLSKQLK